MDKMQDEHRYIYHRAVSPSSYCLSSTTKVIRPVFSAAVKLTSLSRDAELARAGEILGQALLNEGRDKLGNIAAERGHKDIPKTQRLDNGEVYVVSLDPMAVKFAVRTSSA